MRIRDIHNALLYLLRLGLWGRNTPSQNCRLSGEGWTLLFQFARHHTVEAIVYDGINLLAADQHPPKALWLKWTVRVDQIERENQRMNVAIEQQVHLFNRHGIQPLLLKGQGIASMYPNPAHRVCGDVDWAFTNKSAYQQANHLAQQHTGHIAYTPGFSTAYSWGNIPVEHHRRVFDIHNPFCFYYLNQLKKKYTSECIALTFGQVKVFLPAPVLFIVQINVHILKHLLSFGIGLRQLCDAAVAYHALTASIDHSDLKTVYQKLGLMRWIHLLHAVLVRYIGLPVSSLPFPFPENLDPEWLIQEVQQVGNFGFHPMPFIPGTSPEDAREKPFNQIMANFRKYFKYAPLEALSFPMVHFYSSFTHKA